MDGAKGSEEAPSDLPQGCEFCLGEFSSALKRCSSAKIAETIGEMGCDFHPTTPFTPDCEEAPLELLWEISNKALDCAEEVEKAKEAKAADEHTGFADSVNITISGGMQANITEGNFSKKTGIPDSGLAA